MDLTPEDLKRRGVGTESRQYSAATESKQEGGGITISQNTGDYHNFSLASTVLAV